MGALLTRTEGRWLILGLIFIARTVIGLQFQSVGSTGGLLSSDLHLDYSRIGALIGFYELPGLISSVAGGIVTGRLGDRFTCLLGLLVMALGGFALGAAQGFGWAIAARIASGAGAIVFDFALSKMVTDWFAGREIVLAMSIFLASWPFGIAVGLILLGPLAEALGWRVVMNGIATLCCLSALMLGFGYRRPPADIAPSGGGTRSMGAGAFPPCRQVLSLALGGCIWANLNLGLVLFFSFAPDMLIGQGLAPATAGRLTSLAPWVLIVSLPLGGYFVERSGRSAGAIVLFSTLAGVFLILLTLGVSPLLLSAGLGIAVGPPAGPMMALPARILAVENRAAGLAIFYCAYYGIATFGPSLGGLLRDAHGAAAPVLLAAGIFLAIPPMQLLLRALAPTPSSQDRQTTLDNFMKETRP